MPTDITIPAIGESITEVQIAEWLKQEGDTVRKDENLVAIESDKATVEVPAPVGGVLGKILKGDGATAKVGDVIGRIEEGGEAKSSSAPSAGKEEESEDKPAANKAAASAEEEAASDEETAPAASPVASPAQARRSRKKSGKRVWPKESSQAPEPAPADAESKEEEPPSRAQAAADVTDQGSREAMRREEAAAGEGEEREPEVQPMSLLRRTVANRLVSAQRTMAILTTFNEIDMSAVIRLRKEHQDAFQQKHGVKLGFMSFFVKAVIAGLREVPRLNAEIRDNNILQHRRFDIGVAIGAGKGLVVPPLRDADRMSFATIEQHITELAGRARENRLTPQDLEGGTFTISNGGIYGSMLSTPIINPPQSGILGLHAIQERPMAVNGEVVIRPMMYVALSYDHRLVDGREGVTFLKHVKEFIESPARMLIEA